MKVVIIDYGAGNIRSVIFALKRLGVEPILSNSINEIQAADKVIFPGVGEASSAMKQLKENNLQLLMPQLKQPVLGICLGMQLMCSYSEEGNTQGLGIFPVKVKKFTSTELKVPQIGWNTLNAKDHVLFNELNKNEYVYFVHSYYAELSDYTIGTSHYGVNFSSALAKDNFYAVQFHPEKSAKAGEQILSNFLKF